MVERCPDHNWSIDTIDMRFDEDGIVEVMLYCENDVCVESHFDARYDETYVEYEPCRSYRELTVAATGTVNVYVNATKVSEFHVDPKIAHELVSYHMLRDCIRGETHDGKSRTFEAHRVLSDGGENNFGIGVEFTSS